MPSTQSERTGLRPRSILRNSAIVDVFAKGNYGRIGLFALHARAFDNIGPELEVCLDVRRGFGRRGTDDPDVLPAEALLEFGRVDDLPDLALQ